MAAPVKPPGTPAPAPTTPSSPQTAPAKPPADVSPGTVVLIKDFTSPFRRIQQTERMDDAFSCIAMVVHKPLAEVAEAAYRLGYQGRTRYAGKTWQDAEADLQRDWEALKGQSRLSWEQAKAAGRSAWERERG